jgi:hypothetical protein
MQRHELGGIQAVSAFEELILAVSVTDSRDEAAATIARLARR